MTIDLSDGQIANFASNVNTGEANMATLAFSRARTTAARDYAQTMISTHNAAQERQTAVVTALGLTLMPSPLSQELADDTNQIVAQLENASAAEFDILYIRSQVDVHLQVLQIVDEQLLPNVTADTLRSELVLTRTEVEAHLAAARALLATLEALDTDAGVP